MIRNNRPGIQITLEPFHLYIRPMDPPHSCPENMEVELLSPDLFNQRLLSGEEGEEDNEQEVPGLSWHPKPLGVSAETRGISTDLCTFFNRCEYKLFQTVFTERCLKKITLTVSFFNYYYCSCAHLDAGHWAATSSLSTDAGSTCGLPSVPCWNITSAHVCRSRHR